ncbi:protein FD-like [Gastrolobium bilobum]|uniref:protein FD-like n=1 Tax=Gastrolobium bilobum TaxID=150636 RepID=UPI002AB276DA|nr:protein FD-like [Gastrolobium bilobum]
MMASSQTNLPSPCPSSLAPKTPSKDTKSIEEEVWNHIKLDSLCNRSMDMDATLSSTTNTACASSNMILHEFLAGSLNKDSSTTVSTACNPILVADSTLQTQPTLPNFSSRPVFQNHSTHNSSLSSFTTRSSCSKKRVRQDIYVDPSDQRYKRMMKNRESAVRSKARKKAYKNALEIKHGRLTEENSRLRKQVEELQLCLSSSAKPPKMGTLYRTSTCPF